MKLKLSKPAGPAESCGKGWSGWSCAGGREIVKCSNACGLTWGGIADEKEFGAIGLIIGGFTGDPRGLKSTNGELGAGSCSGCGV